MLLEISGEITSERIKGRSQSKNNTQLWTGDRSKVGFCKEQYCIRTWNVRSMNQGKLEVIKQETAKVNIDVLGISKLNGVEQANLTQMAIISTTVGKNP